jgi:hypothetical protein
LIFCSAARLLSCQTALWESWIELGEKFFNAIIAAPVPADMRVLRALRRSPLAPWISRLLVALGHETLG